MRTYLRILLLALLAVGCSEKSESLFDPGAQFAAIEAARKADPVDFATMATTYVSELKTAVSSLDSDADARIMKALAHGNAGNTPHVQSQRVSKLLQKVFFGATLNALHSLPELKGAGYTKVLSEARASFAVLQPTVVRRGEWTGVGRQLDDECLHAFSVLDKQPGPEIALASVRTLEGVLVRTYVLSVLYELEGIEKNRGKDKAKCEEKAVEGQLFLETVAAYAADGSPLSELTDALATPYDEMDVVRARELVAKVFPEYVQSD